MYPFYANPPPQAHPSYHHYQSPPVNAVQYTYPHTVPMSPNPPPTVAFDGMLRERLKSADANFNHTISRLHLPPENKRQLLDCVKHLPIYKHLFMHTYVHLVSCCKSRNLDQLLNYATEWARWDSVKQLACYSLIRDPLLELWKDCHCNQHQSLLRQRFVIDQDDSDLLCLLLYCSKKPALYELYRNQAVGARHRNLKESDQVIELLWKFLVEHQGNKDDMRHLRACIYRMARKYAYLPHGLQIRDACIPNGESFGGGNGILTGAILQGRDVVVKRIACDDRASKKKCLEMLASEAILWGTLRHKNIVPFIGVIENDLDMGLVSPFFRNGDVRNYMNRWQDPRDWLALAWKLGNGLAEALEYIHSHEPPIIHGDIKANNVLVDDYGHACLGDFGQSHALDSRKYLDSTRVGLAACPFHWMAPELTKEEGIKCTDKSDIYSFGCVLYEMVSGKIPFHDSKHEAQVIRRVQKGERPSRPEWISWDNPLWRVVDDCWKHHPQDRPSAARLVRLLQ